MRSPSFSFVTQRTGSVLSSQDTTKLRTVCCQKEDLSLFGFGSTER